MELTNVGARDRVCTCGLPLAIGLQNTKDKATERKEAKGNKRKADAETQPKWKEESM